MKLAYGPARLAAGAFAFGALTALAWPPAAYAVLGADAASIEADRVGMDGVAEPPQLREAYTVHEIRAASGTVVRQYVTRGGRVFAVAWSGPAMPDLRRLLGTYFDAYTAAAQSQPVGPGRMDVQQPGLVVQTGGRMRAFFGRAYVPPLVPQGVALDELR